MAYERLVGMHVTDDAAYERYRDAMRPILTEYGGGFRYDFRVSEVLRSDSKHPINRVFAIFFRDAEACEQFFADPRYLEVRRREYEGAVGAFTEIARYERA